MEQYYKIDEYERVGSDASKWVEVPEDPATCITMKNEDTGERERYLPAGFSATFLAV